jgi:hypothetical protein
MNDIETEIFRVATQLAIRIGEKIIDKRLFSESKRDTRQVIGEGGSVGYATIREGRTIIGSNITAPSQTRCESVTCNIFSQFTAEEMISANAIPMAVIVEEITQEPWLFEIDPTSGFQICLPQGIYSFYVFLLDGYSYSFWDAEILGVAWPSKRQLPGNGEFNFDPPEAVYNLLYDSPIPIKGHGNVTLDMILVNSSALTNFPRSFAELMGVPSSFDQSYAFDLAGEWRIEETSEFGSSTGQMLLIQSGDSLKGSVNSEHYYDDGSQILVQQAIAGAINGSTVWIWGTKIRSITSTSDDTDYRLDEWNGFIENDETIVGDVKDELGPLGQFYMRRLPFAPNDYQARRSSVAARARRQRDLISERKRRSQL